MGMPELVVAGGAVRPSFFFIGAILRGPKVERRDRVESRLAMSEQFTGTLEVFGFADLLQWMELNRRSGRLTLSRGSDRRALDWSNGEIVYVSGSLPRHSLGIHLLRSGALPAPDRKSPRLNSSH